MTTDLTRKKSTVPAPDRQRATFLRLLRLRPNVSRAAKAAGISRQTAYEWRAADEAFRRDWDDALAATLDELEEAGMTRARNGESDLMTMFFLKAHRPETYRETSNLHLSGPNGGALPFTTIAVQLSVADEQPVMDHPE